MRTRTARVVGRSLALVAALAIVGGGCSSSKDDSSTSEASTSTVADDTSDTGSGGNTNADGVEVRCEWLSSDWSAPVTGIDSGDGWNLQVTATITKSLTGVSGGFRKMSKELGDPAKSELQFLDGSKWTPQGPVQPDSTEKIGDLKAGQEFSLRLRGPATDGSGSAAIEFLLRSTDSKFELVKRCAVPVT